MTEEKRTACGIDALIVLCTYKELGECFYPSRGGEPCEHGKAKSQTVCVGSTEFRRPT